MTGFYQKIIAFVMSIIMIPTGSLFVFLQKFDKKEKFNSIFDEGIHEICETIRQDSYVDVEGIVKSFPDVSDTTNFFNKAFNIDPIALRTKIFAARDAEYAKGNTANGALLYFLGAYVSTFKSCRFFLNPVDENRAEIMLDVEYGDGLHDYLHSSVIYDKSTGELYAKDGKGMLGIGFNFNVDDLVVYAVVDCWMRDFGFCFGYDLFCYLTPIFFYNTRRIKFDYAGKEWMVQIWKGLYAVSMGGEVGLYNREKGSFGTFYNTANDEEMIKMSLEIYHGDELILKQSEQPHWWINGFKLSKDLYAARDLTLKSTLEMKDEEMLKAFCEGIDNNIHRDISYTVDGLKVSIVW